MRAGASDRLGPGAAPASGGGWRVIPGIDRAVGQWWRGGCWRRRAMGAWRVPVMTNDRAGRRLAVARRAVGGADGGGWRRNGDNGSARSAAAVLHMEKIQSPGLCSGRAQVRIF
jgi:hypothetical protein